MYCNGCGTFKRDWERRALERELRDVTAERDELAARYEKIRAVRLLGLEYTGRLRSLLRQTMDYLRPEFADERHLRQQIDAALQGEQDAPPPEVMVQLTPDDPSDEELEGRAASQGEREG